MVDWKLEPNSVETLSVVYDIWHKSIATQLKFRRSNVTLVL